MSYKGTSIALLGTDFWVYGYPKAASSFNDAVRSSTVTLASIQDFVEQPHLLSYSGDAKMLTETTRATAAAVAAIVSWNVMVQDTKRYVCMHLTDLRGSYILTVYEQRSNASKLSESSPMAVVCILSPRIVHMRHFAYMEAKESNVLVLGFSANTSLCRYVDIAQEQCPNVVDTHKSIYCQEHMNTMIASANPMSLRLYEDIPMVSTASCAVRHKGCISNMPTGKRYSEGLTLQSILARTDCRDSATANSSAAQLENRAVSEATKQISSLSDKLMAETRVSSRKEPALLGIKKTQSTHQKQTEDVVKAHLCKSCQAVTVLPPKTCTELGHRLAVIHVKVHSYKCSTCSKVYKTIRRYGPSFPCSACFTSLWVTTQ